MADILPTYESSGIVIANGPDPQTRRKKIPGKQEQLIISLHRYYNNHTELEKIMPFLRGDDEETKIVSLRLVDWFVTNYSKRMNISYMLKGYDFNVYFNYKSQLKAYSKKLFDPFCRRDRIEFLIEGEAPLITTVAKLNFFRWAIDNGVLTYLCEHKEEIEKDMNLCLKEERLSRASASSSGAGTSSTTLTADSTDSRRRRRATLLRTLHKSESEVLISFD